MRNLRPQFFRSDLAILIVIKLFQRFGGFGNFLSINHAIMVLIEHCQKRWHRPMLSPTVRLRAW